MTREELIAYDRWLTENKWGSSEIITPEQAADLYLAKHPLPPAEGAEKSCLSCRFHNSPTYHDKMWCRDCQQLSHYEQQPTAEGAGKTCHAKEMEYNHNMCAMQESCEKCEAYKVPTNEGDIAKTETDTGRIVDMPDLSQPTAEGAEELQKLMTDISEWSNKTFGDGQRNPAIVYHLKKEVNELIAVFEGNPRNAHRQLWFEYADCLMLLLDSALHAGFTARDLIDATREKLEINKTRKWGKPDENGVIEHVEQPQPTAEGAEEILAKGRVLMYGNIIVDPIMLPKGIYATKELRIYLPKTTIEHLMEMGKMFRDKTQTQWLPDSYFDNLSKCELIDVDVVRDATLHAQKIAEDKK